MRQVIGILIAESDSYSEYAISRYKELGDVFFWFDMSEEQRIEILEHIHILVLRLALTVNEGLINKMPNLKIIATSTTGLNHIDVVAAKRRDIAILSLQGRDFLSRVPSTAEEAVALLLCLVRKIPWSFDSVKLGEWRSNDWVGIQLAGKTFGIIGFGRLGKIISVYTKAFGMNVIANDPYEKDEIFQKHDVKKVSLSKLFEMSDVISIHASLTPETEYLIGCEEFKKMKNTAVLINTARAEIVDKKELLSALTNREIAGCAFDVWWGEKDDYSHLIGDPLIEYAQTHQNFLITPHIGGTTVEAMTLTQNMLADIVIAHVNSHPIVSI